MTAAIYLLCLAHSVHDQTGYSGEREHGGRGVASSCLHTHGQKEEGVERGVNTGHSGNGTFIALLFTELSRREVTCVGFIFFTHLMLSDDNVYRLSAVSLMKRICNISAQDTLSVFIRFLNV